MNINPDDETFYTIQYQEALLKYVENEHCAKQRRVLVKNPKNVLRRYLIPSAMASSS